MIASSLSSVRTVWHQHDRPAQGTVAAATTQAAVGCFPRSSKCAKALSTLLRDATARMSDMRHTESVQKRPTFGGELSTSRQVIPGTLATAFRDFGDRDSRRLDVIPGTLATKLIGETNCFPISFGR